MKQTFIKYGFFNIFATGENPKYADTYGTYLRLYRLALIVAEALSFLVNIKPACTFPTINELRVKTENNQTYGRSQVVC